MNDELELHNISTLDKARCKAKIIEEKLKDHRRKTLTRFIQDEGHPKDEGHP